MVGDLRRSVKIHPAANRFDVADDQAVGHFNEIVSGALAIGRPKGPQYTTSRPVVFDENVFGKPIRDFVFGRV